MGMSNLDGFHPNKNESYQLGYQQGRADYGNEILNYATELGIENGCIDHEENEDGEWITMTIDYSKWCELWWFIEKHKKLKEQK